ncbi:MAG: hypothetical protein Q8936_13380 [Bacillota bacterium]|nr:hypothetical protein [Bacillota bacterium]
MFNKILKKFLGSNEEEEQISQGSFMVIQLNEKIMPIDRGEIYQDPLGEYLRVNAYGEVAGGGTMQAKSGEIEFCDIEILVYEGNDIKKIITEIISKLEIWGSPKGSHIKIEDTEEEITFGRKEGLAIYLDGVNLPENVYRECDSNFVLSEISRLIGYKGEVERYWQGERETALYFYGDSFIEMRAAILGFVNTYPLCQNSRIVQIA